MRQFLTFESKDDKVKLFKEHLLSQTKKAYEIQRWTKLIIIKLYLSQRAYHDELFAVLCAYNQQ